MIDLQGWMYWQQSDKSSILGKPAWKRRWIVLTPDSIFIYKTDKVQCRVTVLADWDFRKQRIHRLWHMLSQALKLALCLSQPRNPLPRFPSFQIRIVRQMIRDQTEPAQAPLPP